MYIYIEREREREREREEVFMIMASSVPPGQCHRARHRTQHWNHLQYCGGANRQVLYRPFLRSHHDHCCAGPGGSASLHSDSGGQGLSNTEWHLPLHLCPGRYM